MQIPKRAPHSLSHKILLFPFSLSFFNTIQLFLFMLLYAAAAYLVKPKIVNGARYEFMHILLLH